MPPRALAPWEFLVKKAARSGIVAPETMASAGQSTVLVVDDNEQNRALAQAALEDEGYHVVLATGGREGVRRFSEARPDCVLLDVRMPDLDGFGVCEAIRALPGGAETPIIFLTALRDLETFDRAQRVGGADFLTKPVRPAELLARVQAALRLRQLGSERSELYEVIRKQRDDLMRVQLQKERLTAFLVHDLKNPVNALDLHAQLLLRDRSLSEDARASALSIRSEAKRLMGLILNLLDVSKAQEGQLVAKREPLELAALVAEVVEELAVTAAAKSVTLEAEGTASCAGDRDLLHRLLANLVENAIRHAPSRSAVRVSLSRGASTAELRVLDRGAGVPPELHERIFDRFVQLDAGGPSSRGGRGLGLTFCRHVAEAHGGRIWVEDAEPGARFCVRVPDA